VLALTAFLAWEQRYAASGRQPLVPLTLFRVSSFRNGISLASVYFAAMPSMFLLTTLYLQHGLGLEAVFAGMVGIGFALLSAVGSWVGGNLVNRIGRPLVVWGLVILMVGIGAPNYMQVMQDDTSFRPQLLFTETNAARAFYTSADTTDTSILEGALVGGGYGPDQARFEEPTFQECVEILSAAGVETPAPEGFDPDDAANQPYQAAFQACPDIWLTKAALTRAGENLNYGTLAAAIDGLVMTSPGDPTERTYGPAPDNGSPTAYIFRWDESIKNIVLDEG